MVLFQGSIVLGNFISLNCLLKAKFANQPVIIIAQTKQLSLVVILNVIASINGKSFLIDIVTLTECNHQNVSQACFQVITHLDIAIQDILFVTDSAAYCKKAHREVLSNVLIVTYVVLLGGARGVVVITVGNEHGNTSSNPGRD